MHEYDIALKSVLRRLTASVLRELTGFRVARWHNTELPAVRSQRADMLGETAEGSLVHIELQSTNQSNMALRMLEYAVAIHRRFGRFPEQVVLYVGEAKLRMKGELTGPPLDFRCRIADIRQMDGEKLITSSRVEDNVIAVLTELRDERTDVLKILRRIARCGPAKRAEALAELMVLAGLRSLGPFIEREAKQMPILNDIMDHPVLGRERKAGIKIGLERGLEKGRKEGKRELILSQISQRFGPLPDSTRKRLAAIPPAKIERIGLKLLRAESVDELLA